MSPWNWQLPDWPEFSFDPDAMKNLEAEFLRQAGAVGGAFLHFGSFEKERIKVELRSQEAMKTSSIEGVKLDEAAVQSSIQRNLGIKPDRLQPSRPREQGVADLMIETWKTFASPFTDQTLCQWHQMLMIGQLTEESLGTYRPNPEPMQIVKGDFIDPEIHFEAPPAHRVPDEMKRFIDWFNRTAPTEKTLPLPALTRAAMAHVYFESIHPFADGNGRIGRAISEKALSQAAGQPILASISKIISGKQKQYYAALAETRFTNEITVWLLWFGQTVLDAIADAQEQIAFVIRKIHFFNEFGDRLNERQSKVLLRMFREGPGGFTGGLSAANYLSLTKTSPATARRDLGDLVAIGALTRTGEKKGTRYFLKSSVNQNKSI